MDVTSLLYVYDADARHVNRFHPMSAMLADPAFTEAEQRAFWGEVVGESFHLVPELDACSQAAMLRNEMSFKAQPGGLLFMQFVAPGCTDCSELSSAIVSFTASNPGMPVRWVRISVPRSPGGWRREPR